MSAMATDDASGPQGKGSLRHKQVFINGIPGVFFHDRRAVVGGILLLVMIFAAVMGPQLIPYDPRQPDLQDRFATPSWSHWMGTDRNGRDLLARVIAGASTSFKVAVGAALLALVIGAPLGAVTSYIGGIVDDITQRFMDALIAFPARLMAIVLIVLLGPSVVSLWFAIAFSSIPQYARIIRSSVLDQKEREYVEAAHAIGEGRLAILFLYIVPNVLPPMVVQVTLDFASAVTVEASLSFLGLGLVPPTISWGGLLNDAQQWLETAPWLAIFPGAALALTVLSFVLMGDAIRDHLDPRTRRRAVRRLAR